MGTVCIGPSHSLWRWTRVRQISGSRRKDVRRVPPRRRCFTLRGPVRLGRLQDLPVKSNSGMYRGPSPGGCRRTR